MSALELKLCAELLELSDAIVDDNDGLPICDWEEKAERCVVGLAEQLKAALEERERWLRWVSDLQSGMYVNCVYCGHRYGPGETTPVSMADALKRHVSMCSRHPMNAMRIALETIAFLPCAEQDDMLCANMRDIARKALSETEATR